MKSLILMLAFGISGSAYAAAPKVSCELMYGKTDAAGISVDFARGENMLVTKNENTISNKSFTMKASLRQICASDGGPCSDNYTLSVTISKSDSQSHISVTVNESTKWERYSTSLSVGNENGFANCDVEE